MLPVQCLPLAHWSDGSVKWMLSDFVLDRVAEGETQWELERLPADGDAGPEYPHVPECLHIDELPNAIRIDTGRTTFHISRATLQPFRQVTVAGKNLIDSDRCQTVLQDRDGRRHAPQIERIVLEERGPVRATLLFEGRFRTSRPCKFRARLCFFAGTGLVRLRFTLHNPSRARHKGGLWDLGDPGSFLFRSLVLRLACQRTVAEKMTWTAEPGQAARSSGVEALEIYQDSSGGENWQSRNHVNRDGIVPCRFRGYRVRVGTQESTGLRANPLLTLHGADGAVAAGIPEFWQQFPKALSVEENLLCVGLFPEQQADLFELQGGEQKTHTVWFDFGSSARGGENVLDWIHEPATARAAPKWYAATQALEPFVVELGKESEQLQRYLREDAAPSDLRRRREIIDEYGWRNFGDFYADHEEKYYEGPRPVISHYNNQYDVIFGTLLHYLRTGDNNYWKLCDPLARHVIDIDIYHTTEDKAAYNGGLFWFTDHYKSAGTCTHRTYSKDNRPTGANYGGGPASAHNFTTGLLHYYFLTGDPQARAAVIGMADWVIAMDDGRRNILGLVDSGPTGLASCTFELDYQGPGRGPGNSIQTLLDAWQLTRKQRYLEFVEELIERCIHPEDDVAARNFLDVETRWSYTVFLVALARYLSVKTENGEIDDRYAYAQSSLHRYAHWMVENEIPYFEQAEKLEFPTESWAAQEFRKANVLRLAAAHAEEPLRGRLIRRGQELADRAWNDLLRFESRGVIRAVAIALVEGLRDAHLRQRASAKMPRSTNQETFEHARAFVPQKRRVLAKLKSASGVANLVLRLANPWHVWKTARLLSRR